MTWCVICGYCLRKQTDKTASFDATHRLGLDESDCSEY